MCSVNICYLAAPTKHPVTCHILQLFQLNPAKLINNSDSDMSALTDVNVIFLLRLLIRAVNGDREMEIETIASNVFLLYSCALNYKVTRKSIN